jgi:hypothetical protein
MMKHIGFITGDLRELGSVSDVMVFFNCFQTYVEQPHPEKDWSLITDRLYRRYLLPGDLDAASALMEEGRRIMATIPSASVDWKAMGWREDETELEIIRPVLAHVFERYFQGFNDTVEEVTFNLEKYTEVIPIRVGATDAPYYIDDKNRPLSDYDALTGLPFWAY